MKITYTKTSWVDGKTMVNSTNLNHIEDAISNVTTGALGTDQLRAGSGIVISDTVAGDKVIGVDPSITTEIQQLADSLSGCVKAVDGKGLSTNDLTNTLLSKLNSLENYDDTIVKSTIQDIQNQLDTLMNGDVSSAIDCFQEIVTFLQGITDTTTLEGILAGINTSINTAVENERNRAIAAENAIKDSLLPQQFSDVVFTNPYSKGIVPRRIGDTALNTTTFEIWESVALANDPSSWVRKSAGKYGGTLITDFNAPNISGVNTALNTALNAPNSLENWYCLHMNSNNGVVYAVQIAIGFTTGKIYQRLKINSAYGIWTETHEQTRSQNLSTSPSSKLFDDELNKAKITRVSRSVGVNLANPSEITIGKFISQTGNIVSNSGYGITGFIPFSQINSNIISSHYSAGAAYNALYDENFNLIKTFLGNVATWETGVSYVRFSTNGLTLATKVMINFGATLLNYVPYTDLKDKVIAESIQDDAISTNKIQDSAVNYKKIADDGINVENISAFIVGKNKYNPNSRNGKTGLYYINYTNGLVETGLGTGITDFIPITSLGLFCNKSYFSGSIIGGAVYDSQKVFIRGFRASSVSYLSGDAYARFSLNGDLSDCQVEDGLIGTAYESYKKILSSLYLPTTIITDNSITENKIVDGAITNKKIADKSVSENKMTIFYCNLLNPSTIMDNTYISNLDGGISTNTGYQASDYISVKENTRYYMATSTRLWACYDKNKIFTHGGSNDTGKIVDTLPSDVYLRISILKGNILTSYLSEVDMMTAFGSYLLKESYLNPFKNDICLPSKLYMLSGVQNDIFVEPIIKCWNPNKYDVIFAGTASYLRKLQRVSSVNNPVDNQTIQVSLKEVENFSTIASKTTTINVGTKSIGTDEIPVQIIGDSLTNGAFFKDALLTKGYVPNIKMIGLRNVQGYTGQYNEGRGGWTLAKYFTIPKTDTVFHGFMQPTGSFFYWGATGFWINAWKVFRGTAGSNFEPSYSCERYNDYLHIFDETTGYLVSPKNGDIIYDTIAATYKIYDGSMWNVTTENAYTWSFDYSKYLSMWNLTPPKILAEFLGINDFYGGDLNVDFTSWNNNILAMKNSYLNAVPTGKFVILIHSTTVGNLNNDNSGVSMRQINRGLWNSRKNIISTFDNRESEGIYLVDAGIAIDNDYGFDMSNNELLTKPFSAYAGTQRISVQTGNPHPYPNYPTMGISLAAFIQKYR